MTDDIVTRLRRDCMSLIADEAADEIERLRTVVQGWENSARNAERDIAELRAERDEARRWCCLLWPSVCLGHQSAKEYAAVQGWDCFKEKP